MKKELIKTELNVINNKIGIMRVGNVDYISITDLARYKDKDRTDYIIQNWMRTTNSLLFLGTWEYLNNENFNSIEFDGFKNESGTNAFVMTLKKWIKATNAIGIISKQGRYNGGTFAHPDIAFEFASWLSPEFKLYLIKEYIVPTLTEEQIKYVYAEEADVLNVALFGKTAKEWRDENPGLAKNGNIRDYTDLLHLVILNNLQNTNAELIENNVSQSERLIRLNNSARRQMKSLQNNKNLHELERLQEQVNNEKYIKNHVS